MTSEESRDPAPRRRRFDRQWDLPEFAWPLTLTVGVLAAVSLFWFFTRGHEHVSAGQFVGPKVCQECHQKEYDSWSQTRMANSFWVLLPGEKANEKRMVGLDPEADYSHEEACLICHTTGYGMVGGFVSIEETPDLAGVTCEACHGNGGSYAKTVMNPKDPTFSTTEAREAGLIYPPTEQVCLGCHNAGSPFVGIDYQFDYSERVARGTHQHFKLKYPHEK
jgi:hypothetical protein